jgi:DNA-binding NarL/FixJ family response regulator
MRKGGWPSVNLSESIELGKLLMGRKGKRMSVHKCRVLLVDDHVPIRAALRRLLAHYHDVRIVGEASDGQQAIELISSCRPDVILMDINMPKMNGIEATTLITKSWKEAIIIGLCAVEDPHNTNAILKAGAVAVVSKHHLDLLYSTIQRACMKRPSTLSA